MGKRRDKAIMDKVKGVTPSVRISIVNAGEGEGAGGVVVMVVVVGGDVVARMDKDKKGMPQHHYHIGQKTVARTVLGRCHRSRR
jgi:hypothetical protein